MGEVNSKNQNEQNTRKNPNLSWAQPQQTKSAYTYDDYADNVKSFSAQDHEFVEGFIKQLECVQKEFQVSDRDLKVLIVKKLEGNAKEWFHCKPAHIRMTAAKLLEELRRTYGHTGNYQKLFQAFQNRIWEWKQGESFFDYYQAKLKLAAGLNLSESQMVKHLIDGFRNDAFSIHARAMKIHKTSVLLERMQQEIERSKVVQMSTQPKAVNQDNPLQCFKCKGFGHKIQNCPSKSSAPYKPEQKKGKSNVQCFNCKRPGHRVEDCFFKKQKSSQNNENKENDKSQQGLLCRNCFRTGHKTEVCQFPTMPNGVCHNCGSTEHLRPQCPHLKNKIGKVLPKEQTMTTTKPQSPQTITTARPGVERQESAGPTQNNRNDVNEIQSVVLFLLTILNICSEFLPVYLKNLIRKLVSNFR